MGASFSSTNTVTAAAVRSIGLSPITKSVVLTTGYPDLSVLFLDPNGNLKWRYQLGGVADVMKISADESCVGVAISARAGIGDLVVIDFDGKLLWKYSSKRKLQSIDISKEAGYFVVGSKDGTIITLDASGKLLWKYGPKTLRQPITAIIPPRGDSVVGVSQTGNFYFLNLHTGEVLKSISTKYLIDKVAISYKGDCVIAGYEDPCVFYFDRNGKLRWQKVVHSFLNEIAITPEGDHIGLCFKDGEIQVLSHDGSIRWKYQAEDAVNCIAISREADLVVAGTNDFNVYLFDRAGIILWHYIIGYGLVTAEKPKKI
jgi:outer membrane protein assembly factor BamB